MKFWPIELKSLDYDWICAFCCFWDALNSMLKIALRILCRRASIDDSCMKSRFCFLSFFVVSFFFVSMKSKRKILCHTNYHFSRDSVSVESRFLRLEFGLRHFTILNNSSSFLSFLIVFSRRIISPYFLTKKDCIKNSIYSFEKSSATHVENSNAILTQSWNYRIRRFI